MHVPRTQFSLQAWSHAGPFLLGWALWACSAPGAGDANGSGGQAGGGVSDAGVSGGGAAASAGLGVTGGVGGSDGAGADAGAATAGANDAGNTGTDSSTTGPRVATVGTPLKPSPAPGLAGPVVKVDLDMSGRPTGEVTELGYVAWPVTSGASLSKTLEGVTFTFEKSGNSGSGLGPIWQKAAVQAPNYARLVGDGLTVTDADAGAEIRLTLRGLAAGKHSLLAWHNVPGADASGKVSLQVDGTTQGSSITPSSGALANSAAPSSYVTFNAQAGKDVVVLFSSSGNLVINGFELDTPNVVEQATDPTPADGDEHVDADSGKITLSWHAAKQAASHDVYFGTDPNQVQGANHDAAEFKGNQRGTSYPVSGLNSIDRYYFRIDELDASGKTTRGNVWYFRPRHLAFPGAEGYGRFAIGGRGGVVVHVTNLKDSGAGSFRDAVETARGPRTIVFDVGGIVPLASRLVLTDNYVTVAGQTAPGKGIVFRAAPFGISGVHDGAVRHLRVRLGHGTTYDGMGLTGSNHAIVDHASISWTIDEGFSSRNGKNITLQRTLISECLNVAGHQNYPPGTAHGYAGSIGGDVGSFHHNLLAHCEGRNWSMAGGLDPNGNFSGRLDLFNNVVYNWGHRTTDGGAHEVNFVNNYYRPGPSSAVFAALKADYDNFPGKQQYYCAGNVMPGRFDESAQSKACVQGYGTPQGYSPWVDKAWFESYATVHSARDAFKNVLSDVGNSAPLFDDHDIRVVKETVTGTTTYKGSVSGDAGLPDSELDVGGYENYPSDTRDASWDSDGDGLPDFWETAAGLNPTSAKDDFTESNTDYDGDGYTALEEYLAFMAAPHFITPVGKSISVDVSKLFAGFTNAPSYSSPSAEHGSVTLADKTATFAPTSCGLARFTLKVADKDGSSMTREVLVLVNGACQ